MPLKLMGLKIFQTPLGGNYRYTELQAAIAIEQFKKLQSLLDHRKEVGSYLSDRLRNIDGLKIQEIEKGCTHSYYMYPIRFEKEVFGISRNLFLRAVSAELPKPKYWDTTPLSEGYVKPLYLNPIYQKQIAIGKKGFPFTYNKDVKYDYSKGICPVTEKLYEEELLLSPLVREGMKKEDIKDFADAIEKVVGNISELRDSNLSKESNHEVYDAIKAIDDNVKN